MTKIDKREVFTQIEIEATREQVWSVLTDFEKMPEWSSSFQSIGWCKRQGCTRSCRPRPYPSRS